MLASAHCIGDGDPPTIFNNKYSKIGSEFSVLAIITLGQPQETFSRDVPRSRHENLSTAFGGPAPLECWRAKNIQNLAPFRTTTDFDREYLRNGSIHRHAENAVIYNTFHAPQRKLVNFGSLTKITKKI